MTRGMLQQKCQHWTWSLLLNSWNSWFHESLDYSWSEVYRIDHFHSHRYLTGRYLNRGPVRHVGLLISAIGDMCLGNIANTFLKRISRTNERFELVTLYLAYGTSAYWHTASELIPNAISSTWTKRGARYFPYTVTAGLRVSPRYQSYEVKSAPGLPWTRPQFPTFRTKINFLPCTL